jgi:hypothetical protein
MGAYKSDPKSVGLPPRSFLYTLDQVSALLGLSMSALKGEGYSYFEGRSHGRHKKYQLLFRNIAPPTERRPEWRVAEQEFIRWMKYKGFKSYETVNFY